MAKRGAENHDKQFETANKRAKYDNNSPVVENSFNLDKELVPGTVITDIKKNRWRIGRPFGKGSFGEIFLASSDIKRSVTAANANYVVKIEPHCSGPLFVEIHCLMNTGRATENSPVPPGMPEYIASGSHLVNSMRYRFLVLPRYKFDLHSVVKNRCIDEKNLLVIAIQTLDVLEHLHNKGYVHADIKAANMMIGSCTMKSKENEDTDYDSNNDSEVDSDIELSSNEENNQSDDELYKTPLTWSRPRLRNNIEFSGTNPVRSCRMSRKTSVYDDMLNLHYLRPHKKIDYSMYDAEEDNSDGESDNDFEASSYYNKMYSNKNGSIRQNRQELSDVIEDRIYLIDFGLALKYLDARGQHKPFCMDERRAHDGTLEFTSRDAHMGAHSRRSDLECLGYNLIYWSQGWLPWKQEKILSQPEQVHRMKEHFMTDIVEMLKRWYGESVPKYLGQFLEYIGKLAYHETPDYKFCRNIFSAALNKIGIKPTDFKIDVELLKSNPRRVIKDEVKMRTEKLNKNVKDLLNLNLLLPPRENGSAKISPKNLRSKSDKIPKKQRKKFSWTDVLNSDPDQIAKQRAEKEYENDQTETPISIKYTGRPNYEISRLENRLKFRDRLDIKEDKDSDIDIKTDVVDTIRKRKNVNVQRDDIKKSNGNRLKYKDRIDMKDEKDSDDDVKISHVQSARRRKSGLRRVIRVPSKCASYRETLSRKRRSGNSEFTPTDESTCSSTSSIKNGHVTTPTASDEDSRDTTDYTPIKARLTARPTVGKKKISKKKLSRRGRPPSRKIQRDEQLKRINTRSG